MAGTILSINGAKLKAELKRVGVTSAYASVQLGYEQSYLSYCCAKNTISRPAAVALNGKFNIPFEAYKDKPDEEKPAPAQPAAFDYDALYKVIYSAVYDAVKKAWNE